VCADGVERPVTELDVTVVAGEDVQPDQGDRVDEDERRLERPVIGQQEGQHARGSSEEDPGDQGAAAHRRETCTLPKKPEGFTRSTPTMSTRATTSLSSLPMTNAPSTFSRTPTRRQPTNAPSGL